MSHLALNSGYTEMVERLNGFPQGTPSSDTLYKILRLLLMASQQVKSRSRLTYDFGAYSACNVVSRGSRPVTSPA